MEKAKDSTLSLRRRDLLKLVPQGAALCALSAVSPRLSGSEAADSRLGRPSVSSSSVFQWEAKWIWEPIEELFHNPPPRILVQGPPFKNLFTYFRRRIDIQSKPKRATLRITADSRYKLYVNGMYVGRGPVRCEPAWQYYDEYDLTPHLQVGANVLGVLHHFYGEDTGWYVLGRPGVLAECEMELAGGDSVFVKTDASWKFHRAAAFSRDTPRINGALGFVEVYDARFGEADWARLDFDDSRWKQASIISRDSSSTDMPRVLPPFPWENLVARNIPFLTEKEIFPAQVTALGEVDNLPFTRSLTPAEQMTQESPHELRQCALRGADHLMSIAAGAAMITTTQWNDDSPNGQSAVLLLDFGREITGYPRIEVDGVVGGIVDIGVSESLVDGRVTPTRNGLHANRYIMKDGLQAWETFEWDGFRYMQLTIRNCPAQVALHKVAVNFTSYPVGERGSFECSNPKLNRIWELCRHTLQLCMHDAYEDCPNREQRQWVGDAYVESKVNYAVFGDTRLATKMVRQVAQSQRSDGITSMFAPGASDHGASQLNIKDFVFDWIGSVWELYRYTGDEGVLREFYSAMSKAVDWFAKRVGPAGLLREISPWIFCDWAPVDKRGENTLLNALLVNALNEVSQAAAIVGDDVGKERMEKLAIQIRSAMQEHLWDEDRGVFVDGRMNGLQSRRVSQQANAVCLLYDIASSSQRKRILTYIFSEARVKRWEGPSMPALITLPPGSVAAVEQHFNEDTDVVQAQPFFAHWVNAALAHVGSHEIMLRLIESGWGEMLAAGATSAWETWSADASECHGWSSTPAHDLPSYILGIRGIKPGFKEFTVEPHPVALQRARGVRPSQQGDISASWECGPEHFRIQGNRPRQATATVLVPLINGRAPREIILAGQTVWKNGNTGSLPVQAQPNGVRVPIRVTQYEIEAKY